jgi:hypothetical protein
MRARSCHACVQVLKTVHSMREAPPLAQGEASGGGEREGDGPPASSGGVSGARDVPQPHKASRPKLVSCLCAYMPCLGLSARSVPHVPPAAEPPGAGSGDGARPGRLTLLACATLTLRRCFWREMLVESRPSFRSTTSPLRVARRTLPPSS